MVGSRRQTNITNAKILREKPNLEDLLLDEKGKEEFLTKADDFHDVFSLRDEIGMCPFIEVNLRLKDETPFFCTTISYVGRTKEGYSERNG